MRTAIRKLTGVVLVIAETTQDMAMHQVREIMQDLERKREADKRMLEEFRSNLQNMVWLIVLLWGRINNIGGRGRRKPFFPEGATVVKVYFTSSKLREQFSTKM